METMGSFARFLARGAAVGCQGEYIIHPSLSTAGLGHQVPNRPLLRKVHRTTGFPTAVGLAHSDSIQIKQQHC